MMHFREESVKEPYTTNKNKSNRIPKLTSSFVLEAKFPDEKSAIDRLTAEEIWYVDRHRGYSVKGGRKVYYRCNRVNVTESPCSVMKCLYSPKDSEEVWMYKTNTKHDHDKTTPAIRKIYRGCQLPTGAVRKKVRRPMENGLKIRIFKLMKLLKSPTEILLQLEYEGFEVKYHVFQIRNYCSKIRRKIISNKWRFEESFNTIAEAKLYLKRQKIWNYKFHNDSQFSKTYHYRCKLVPRVGLQCAARKMFRFNKCTKGITLYRKGCPHTHMDITRPEHLGVVTETNWLLKQLSECNRNVLKDIEFRVLKAVSLKDCHTNHETSDLPLHLEETKLIPNSYPNSNIIVKEELIIVDEPMKINQPESNSVKSVAYCNDDAEQKIAPKTWWLENKFANINEASNFLSISNEQWQLKSDTNQTPFYRCTYPCDPECPARLSFLIKKGCDEVFYFSGEPHSHPIEIKTEPSLSATEKICISDTDTESHKRLDNPKKNEFRKIPFLNGFSFKEKFANMLEARNKMGQNWVFTCSRQFNNEGRQYFRCGYNTEDRKCPCRAVLLRRIDYDEVLYYTTSSHTHIVSLSEKETTEIENPTKTTGCTDEIITRKSDSGNYDDSLNGGKFCNTQEKWVFETKFNDYITAKQYMTNLNLLSPSTEDILCKSNVTNQGVKEYYNCNLVGSDVGHCPASKYLLYEDINSDTLVYNRNIRHAEKCTNITSALMSTIKRPNNGINNTDSDNYNCNLVSSDVGHCPASKYLYEDVNNDTLVYNRNIRHVEKCTNITSALMSTIKRPTNGINDTDSDNDPNTIRDNESLKINNKKWVFEKEFKTFEEAVEYLKDQIVWTRVAPSTVPGNSDLYRCNLTRRYGKRCESTKFLQVSNETKVVYMYKSKQGHTHDPLSPAARAKQVFESLDYVFKAKIKELVRVGNTPNEIYAKLGLKNFNSSLKKFLFIWIARMRRNLFKKNADALENLSSILSIENWLLVISKIPENDDAQFCVNFNINHSNETFQCFLSTRRLLKNAMNSCLVNIDSTYSLNWQQNPITIIGTTDLDQKFHIFGIAVCSNKNECDYEFMFKALKKGVRECHNKMFKPECLIADENEAVRNAFIKTFGISSHIGICSTIALSKIIHKLSTCLVSNTLKSLIKEDILKIQKLSTQSLFFKAVDVFLRKWRAQGELELEEFLSYFKADWVDRNPNWFQGFRPFTSHTNNALRNEYDSLRKCLGLKQNLPILAFLDHTQIEVERLSRCYGNGEKRFINQPIYHSRYSKKPSSGII